MKLRASHLHGVHAVVRLVAGQQAPHDDRKAVHLRSAGASNVNSS